MKVTKAIQAFFIFTMVVGGNVYAESNCAGFEAFPGGAEEGKKTHVLYRDYVKKDDFQKAYPLWQKLYEHSPAGHVYHYIDGIAIYKSFYENTDDAAKQEEYLKKIIGLYKERMECISPKRKDKPKVMGMMAYDMYLLQSDEKETCKALEETVKMSGNKTPYYVVDAHADHCIRMFAEDMLDKAYMQNLYKQLMDIIAANEGDSDFAETKTAVEEYFQPYEEQIFDCEYFKAKLKKDYDADPNNPEVYRTVLKSLLQKGCSKEDAFVTELMEKDKGRIMAMRTEQKAEWEKANPDMLAKRLLKSGQEDQAIPLFEQSLNMDIPSERKASAAYYLAKIYYKKRQRGQARTYAQQAAGYRSGWGAPYMLIAEMYASSGRACGSGTGWNSQVVVWPAIDMWNKAKSIDPSVSDKANRMIAKYSRFMPNKEDAFQRGVKEGQSYRVGCWIQTTTRVRLSSKF